MDIFVIGGLVLIAWLARRLLWLLSGPWCDYTSHSLTLPTDAFVGKVCWVTGASSGIGEALVRELAARGAYIVASARRADTLEAIAKSLPSGANRVHVLPFDLASVSADELNELASRAIAAFGGRLDYLFNNAGVSTRAMARDLHPSNLEAVTRLNFVAPALLSRACIPALMRSKGAIVNTSSIASFISIPLRSAYCASKTAISTWHECLRLEELGKVGVVNVCPGYVRTDIARNAFVSDKGKRRESSDMHIENGLPVSYVAERMLAVAHGRIRESWIARGRELCASYLFVYFPGAWPPLSHLIAARYLHEINHGLPPS